MVGVPSWFERVLTLKRSFLEPAVLPTYLSVGTPAGQDYALTAEEDHATWGDGRHRAAVPCNLTSPECHDEALWKSHFSVLDPCAQGST